jgi:hypothetical protein
MRSEVIRNLLRAKPTYRSTFPKRLGIAKMSSATSSSPGGALAKPPSAEPSPESPSSSNNLAAEKTTLALPEPPKDGDAVSLTVGGEGIKLDRLGPLVIHQDGTVSRIANWAEMSEIEKENTFRVLGKRNQLRLKKLREEEKN